MNGLKYIRDKMLNKTMEELALELDISKQAMYMWEGGKKIPEARIKQLSKLSGVPEKYFLIESLEERDILEIKNIAWERKLMIQVSCTSIELKIVMENGK